MAPMLQASRYSAALLLTLFSFCSVMRSADHAANPPDADRLALKIEALKRIEGIDLDTNPSLKSAVLGVLEATRGTPYFVELVQQFNLVGYQDHLVELALQNPNANFGVDAVRLVLDQGHFETVRMILESTNTTAATQLASALGHTRHPGLPSLLLPLVTDLDVPLALRKQSVLALTQTQEGAKGLLELSAQNQLPLDLRFTASTELNRVRWSDIKSQAATLLPLPQGPDAQPLPPLVELLQRKGNPERGRTVFQTATASCSGCHKARDIGTDVGPNLSEIGGKLGKDALYEALLEPSAGISFGFEAWSLELKSGEEAYGIITSETPGAIALKDTQGIVTQYDKNEIAGRTQMQLSLMPTGLQQAMSVQELVDLIEFLATLK